MSVTIKSTAGATLYVAESVNDMRAAVREAVETGADLSSAYLRGADLGGADLRGADLGGAYLRSAYLRGADLRGADLRGAEGYNPHAVNDLQILLEQVGKIRAYKLVRPDGQGPYNGGITYQVGQTYEVKNANTNPDIDCAAGINLATLPWCFREWRSGYRILVAEFTNKDIAAIPNGDGKFRVHRCKIVKELDLIEIGLGRA